MGAGAQLCSGNGIGQAVCLLVSVCVSFSFSFGVFLTYFSVTNRCSLVRPGSKLTMWNLFYDMSKCRPGCPCYLHNCFGNNHSELNAGWSFPMTPLPQAVIRFPEGGVRSWSRTPLVYDPDIHTTLGAASNPFMLLSPHLSLLLLSPAVKGFGLQAVPGRVRPPGVAGPEQSRAVGCPCNDPRSRPQARRPWGRLALQTPALLSSGPWESKVLPQITNVWL